MTVDFTLRLPKDLDEKLAAWRPAGMSRHAQILQVLNEHCGDFDPQLVLGFIELRGGEVTPDALCPECQMEFSNRGIYLGFTAALRPFGPVCGVCATTD